MPFSCNLEKLEESKINSLKVRTNFDIKEDKRSNLVLDQINRSVVIQTSIMPGFTSNSCLLKDGFLLFKPKNKLSGDFYWSIEHNGNLIFVLGDSTGHGIPGAMLSMIAFTVLNSLNYSKLGHSPSKIIKKIHQAVSNNFRNSLNHKECTDGFDLAVTVLSKKSNSIRFSGAKRPLIVIRGNEIMEFKGDHKTTGIETPYDYEFEEICMKYFQGDRIYMFSDGFQDQFGGECDKKFTYKRFKKLLVSFCDRPIQEQHDVYQRILDTWRLNCESTDDVSLLGVEVA